MEDNQCTRFLMRDFIDDMIKSLNTCRGEIAKLDCAHEERLEQMRVIVQRMIDKTREFQTEMYDITRYIENHNLDYIDQYSMIRSSCSKLAKEVSIVNTSLFEDFYNEGVGSIFDAIDYALDHLSAQSFFDIVITKEEQRIRSIECAPDSQVT